MCIEKVLDINLYWQNMWGFTGGEVPYNCDVCRKRYSHKFRLTEHMMVYTVERPYICDLWGFIWADMCGKVCTENYNDRTHEGSYWGHAV